jgi:DNA end-binding protein Ku
MPRSIWKGSLAFGLVNIPVELHTAVRDSRPRFRMLHRTDESPIEFQRVCRRDGKPVAWEDLVKGFEYAKGQYVVLTKDDFETAALERSRTVDVLEFVDADAIDDRFFEQPYYLAPTRGAERAYAVLREALRKSGKVGIARIILREKQHLAAVEVARNAMVLTMMRFAEELVDEKELSLPTKELVRDKELDMAVSLVESLSDDWKPEKYKDEYTENLMKVINAKLKGKRPKLEAADVQPGQAEVIDLMERLRDSLGMSKARARAAARTTGKAAAKTRGGKTASSARTRTAARPAKKAGTAARARKTKKARRAA